MVTYGFLYVWAGIGVLMTITLSLLLGVLIQSYYRRESVIDRGLYMFFSVMGILVGSWMMSFELLIYIAPLSGWADFLNVVFLRTFIVGPIIALFCIGVTWLVSWLSVYELKCSLTLVPRKR